MSDQTKLTQRVLKEQADYLDAVRKMPADQIIERAYEICYREEIAILLTCDRFNHNQLKVLLDLPNPVGFIYNEWLKTDASVCGMLNEVIEEVVNE